MISVLADAIANALKRSIESRRLPAHSERALQDDLALRLRPLADEHGWTVRREEELAPGQRPDFLVGSATELVPIECKVGGSELEVLRQCDRYLRIPSVSGLVLLTTHPMHGAVELLAANGKRVMVVFSRSL